MIELSLSSRICMVATLVVQICKVWDWVLLIQPWRINFLKPDRTDTIRYAILGIDEF
ncbi:uncharacterized protein DS421_6g189710 [Arachis hypogaea]|nr:uncharacterized protein DS421_6g189710 [Arachis hypogaea]